MTTSMQARLAACFRPYSMKHTIYLVGFYRLIEDTIHTHTHVDESREAGRSSTPLKTHRIDREPYGMYYSTVLRSREPERFLLFFFTAKWADRQMLPSLSSSPTLSALPLHRIASRVKFHSHRQIGVMLGMWTIKPDDLLFSAALSPHTHAHHHPSRICHVHDLA